MRGVVGNQEAFEAHLLFQDFSQEDAAGRAFDPIPTAIGRHDGGNAFGDRGDVPGKVNAAKVGVAQPRVALVKRIVPGAAASGEPRAEDRAAVSRDGYLIACGKVLADGEEPPYLGSDPGTEGWEKE